MTSECSKCKYAVWDYEDYSPFGWKWFISCCKLGNNEEDDCKYFEEEEEDDE